MEIVIEKPDLGITGSPSTAWSNPLLTHEIHHSHIEGMINHCAKRSEFEFMGGYTRDRTAKNLSMAQGSAAHYIVDHMVKQLQGKEPRDYEGVVDFAWCTFIEPAIDEEDEIAEKNKLERNALAALSWLNKNVDIYRVQTEKPFLIKPASDVIAGISDEWSLAGSIDSVEYDHEKKHARIFDLKFRGRPNPEANRNSSQPFMYSLANQFYGYTTSFAFVEIINGKIIEQEIPITAGGMEFFAEKVRQTVTILQTGFFPMNPSYWGCSAKYCWAWKLCRGRFEAD